MNAFHSTSATEDQSKIAHVDEEVLRQFLERIPGGLFRYRADEDDTLDIVTTGLLEIFGCSTYDQFIQLTGNTFSGMVYEEDRERVLAEIDEQTQDSDRDRVYYRIVRADGEIRWIDDSGRLVEDSDGVKWFYVNVIDVTDRVEGQQKLERANERLNILTALSNDVLFDIDCSTGMADVYGDFEGRFGRPPAQPDFVVHRRCQKDCNIHIESHGIRQLMGKITDESLVDFETSTVDSEGNPVWYRYQSIVLYDDEGNPIRHVGRLLDTHDMAVRESQFRRKAERDGLTGLYNRSAALDRIDTMLASEKRPCTLITIDVDDFKAVNDTYGHPEGDRVLKDLAAFLGQAMRKEDVVARMGGDEFAIFAPGLGPGAPLERILDHLARGPFASSRATDVGEPEILHEATPSVSIGAACCEQPPISFEDLYAAADEALYKAKAAGKSTYQATIL
ncbi:MAG: diguanylate cyclase [Eggerthellaceae bacterium]|nr:diguanylate cyclase [Eggerthellaceae bacterium]